MEIKIINSNIKKFYYYQLKFSLFPYVYLIFNEPKDEVNNNYKSNMDKTAAYNIETMYENITFQGV